MTSAPPPVAAPRPAYRLTARQGEAMDAIWVDGVEQLLYGGAGGGGKMLDLRTPIPTPDGWTTMGELRAGDWVLGEHGRPVRVLIAHPVERAVQAYRLTFDDGTQIDACADHQWLTFDIAEMAALTRRDPEWRARRRAKRPSRATGLRSAAFAAAITERNRRVTPPALAAPSGTVRTTAEIVATLRTEDGRTNHAILVAAPLDLPPQMLPLDPYLLGLWLGDGAKRDGSMTTMDASTEAAFIAGGFPPGRRGNKPGNRAWTFTARGLKPVLRGIGVLGDKHIPQSYLRGSRDQRLALLQGLMDTDGTVTDSGKPEFTNTNKRIVDGVYELIVSLGWKARVVESIAKLDGRYISQKWDIKWSPDDYVFRLPRKRERQVLAVRRTTKFRYITDAQPIESVEMRCISVDSPSHLYLAGRSMVPTHNSRYDRALAFHLAMMWPGARIAIFRDNYTQLSKTQVVEWHKEMDRLGFAIKEHWHATSAEWHFTTAHPYNPGESITTVVEFLHLDQSIGAEKWLSAEWAAIIVDEATQIPEEDHQVLYSRVRANSESRDLWRRLADDREAEVRAAGVTDVAAIARARSDWRPLAVYTTNPGSVSHDYFKREFVDAARTAGGKPWEKTNRVVLLNEEVEVTTRRQFIQALLTDNPYLDHAQYAAGLAHLPKRRREQIMSGNWDFFEGQVFDMLQTDIHLVDARWAFGNRLTPPAEWPRLGGLDHGTQNPTAAEWMTRDEDGFFLVGYLEYYAAGPNKQHIEAIRALLMLDGRYDLQFEADPQMWRKRQGFARVWSVADEFAFGGEPPEDRYEQELARQRGIRLRPSSVERIAARMALERMFEPDLNLVFPDWHPRHGEAGAPRAFVCTQAPNLWRELTNLKYVPGTEETVKENDHAVDAAFRVMPVFEQALYAARRNQPRQVDYVTGGRR